MAAAAVRQSAWAGPGRAVSAPLRRGRTAALSGDARQRKKLCNALGTGAHGSSPHLLPTHRPGRCDTRHGVRRTARGKISAKLRGVTRGGRTQLPPPGSFFLLFSPSWGPDGGGGSRPGAVSRSAQPHAKPNGPWRPRQLQCHLLLQLHRFPATGNGDM